MANNIGNTTGDCDGCADSFSISGATRINYGNESYCAGCVKDRLDMAINSSTAYPVVLGGVQVHPSDARLAPLFSNKTARDNYIGRFDIQAAEWETPAHLRMFCDCPVGMFVGALIRGPAGNEATIAGCGSCQQLHCLKCGKKTDYSDAKTIEHMRCQYSEAAARQTQAAQQFQGMVRGVQYQTCPRCEVKLERDGGCNHITCGRCQAHFCYICGCKVDPNAEDFHLG